MSNHFFPPNINLKDTPNVFTYGILSTPDVVSSMLAVHSLSRKSCCPFCFDFFKLTASTLSQHVLKNPLTLLFGNPKLSTVNGQ